MMHVTCKKARTAREDFKSYEECFKELVYTAVHQDIQIHCTEEPPYFLIEIRIGMIKNKISMPVHI